MHELTIPAAEDCPIFESSEVRKQRTRKNARRKSWEDADFILWDGEGGHAGDRKPQHYILLGCYDGSEHEWITGERLTTFDCLALIMEVGRRNPNAFHVSFAFGYDVSMILHNLTTSQFRCLAERGYAHVWNYRIEHVPGKWFRVTEYGPLFGVNGTDKFTVTIFDTWGFFQSSLIAALKANIPDHPLMVANLGKLEDGKRERQAFTFDKLDYILDYWKIENELAHALIVRLREMLYSVDLKISSWHGPGALASYAFKQYGVKAHKSETRPEVYDAARYAYAGGRFERFHIGRYRDAFGYDINSAYPHAIAQLPSLSEGVWTHVTNPRRLVEFGMYHVRLRGGTIKRAAGPLFHRDRTGLISFPWRTEGWYWSPEIAAMLDLQGFQDLEILEAWEYNDWESRPFAFVADLYEQRKAMKAAGIGAQMALKLLLNSLYGKTAQRTGWQRTGRAPTWHQLEWAGWVTSYTRASLFRLMNAMPYDKLIAVETDGIYSTATPDELGIVDSKDLGGWEVSSYDELIYLQSGVYAKRAGKDWSLKYRGLDKDSFGDNPELAARAFAEFCKRLQPGEAVWPNLTGTTTRFIGYKHALFRQTQNRGPMQKHLGVWETEPKEISCGAVGKRAHSWRICAACAAEASAYDMPHETVIMSRTMFETDDLWSQRHDIPWIDDDTAEWRKDEWQIA